MGKAFKVKVTPEVFEQIHTLREIGKLGPSVVARITKLSPATISRVSKATSLEDYLSRERIKANKIHQSKHTQTPKIMEPSDVSQDLTLVLSNLTNAIVSLANAWHGLEGKLDEVLETKRPWINKFK